MLYSYLKKTSNIIILVGLTLALFNFGWGSDDGQWTVSSAQAAGDLRGRILLQVQDKGQAWYVNPLDLRRYYLGRPDDAYSLMRSLGLGVSNADMASFRGYAPSRLAGRILLQVEDKGQAFYVSPLNYQLYYLGRPQDAFNVMRSQGLGITNSDLEKIAVAGQLDSGTQTISYQFKYQNRAFNLSQDLSANWHDKYSSSPKVLSYSSATPPPNLRDAFYKIFLTTQAGDDSIKTLGAKLKSLAADNAWTGDQLVEFSLAFIQFIPYDHAKLSESDNRNTNPYYPYETLFLNRGVCSDKTFLAVALLRELGYGAAILDFPDSNHSAVGISCPLADSISGSGYCYGETTNYFPIGVVPQNISSGQAVSQSSFSVSYSAANLGKVEIYQASSGLEYRGVTLTKSTVNAIQEKQLRLQEKQALINTTESEYRQKEAALVSLRAELDAYLTAGQTSAYNQLVPEYNRLVNEYNAGLAAYQEIVQSYNSQAAELNQAVRDFYQK